MNEVVVRSGFWFLAGVVAGAAGVGLMARQDSSLRGAVVGTLAHGMTARDKVLSSVARAKENVEDMVAEAKHTQSSALESSEQSK
ncbi:DUF6110 family protein [Desulfonatronum parangueonense]